MYELIIKTTTYTNVEKYMNRLTAENIADKMYKCADVYAFELLNCETGELLYYKSKG